MNGKANNDVPPDLLDDLGENDEEAVPAESAATSISISRPPGIGEGRSRGHPPLLGDPARLARRLPHDRCQGRRALCRQGASLKARVGSYARGLGHSNRIARMIAETAAMEFVTTATEIEALLLEANLIKQLTPRYNVLLRDDKSLPYILLTGRPRGAADRQASRRPQAQGRVLRAVRQRLGGEPDHQRPAARLSPAHRATTAIYENRTRPCLLFQIKRCSGPCTGEISLDGIRAGSPTRRAPSCPASRTP